MKWANVLKESLKKIFKVRTYNRVNTAFSIPGAGELDRCVQKIKRGHQLTPHTRINSKWVKGVSASHKTIKILEESIGSKISDISQSNIFANISPRARDTQDK